MALLSDELLMDSYEQAIQLQLDDEFIALLLKEIRRRRLHPTLFQKPVRR
ncbi:sporulation histidine kinase inhibitor Sda [Paenibacillus apiarius]|uniref:Sporulation histidine kinase inhibitor Sda n=1 Tax=Paenibacillus apiarius TaxID=46240 RepID=A0ABT4E063_9BACL|nr:sporulation histidine kinase inhibitor Sda [Paenibacillus apiarius]MBN3525502.1 sporulation histidine kinase inhibitor Sda [Paenibacillus apiarius]MCY9512649.1 sporulation histidine kinase inhibitor Sda [Paenibacillus apiarius]MCY9522989.1 sporulation histidine kinase inhibitor Sda [Paenibacillus apiarius]MCY9550749.1 sporulation histidine kinase inhibitor Sda [Paenibacillus apiarius]MCY9556573.1 sporulation histidine kinase inhibitor Sda [Paenibacillus apiarius]